MGAELTSAQRAMALTMMVEQQLGQANGDMAKTMDTPAGRARRLSVALADLRTSLGNIVLPIWNAVMPGLIALANALTAVFNRIASVINGILSLFGLGIKGGGGGGGSSSSGGGLLGDVADSAGAIGSNLADGLSDAGSGSSKVADDLADASKSTKEIAKGLMGIDELNVLSSPDNGSGSGGSGGSGGSSGGGTGGTGGLGSGGAGFGDLGFSVEESENNANDLASKIPAWVDRLAKIFKSSFDRSFNYDMFEEFVNNCKRVGQSIVDIFSNQDLQIATSALNNTLVAELGSFVGMVGTLGFSIGNAIVGGIADSLEENKEYIIDKLISITNIEREASVIRQRLYEALSDIFSTLGGEEAQGIVNNIFTTLTVGFLEGQELFSKIGRDAIGFVAQAIIDNKDKIKEALTGALSFGDSITGSIGEVIQNIFKHINDVYDEKVKPFIDSMSQGFSDLFGTLLDGWNKYVQPVLDEMGEKFDEVMNGNVGNAIQHTIDLIGNVLGYLQVLWEETLKPIAEFLIDVLAPVFAGAFDIIGTVVLNFIDVVAGIVDGIIQVFNGIIEFITGIFSGDLEQALGGLGKVWEGIVTIVSTIWDSVFTNSKELLGKIWKHICKIWEQIKESVVDYVLKMKDKVVEKFNKLKDTVKTKWEEIKTATINKCKEIYNEAKKKWEEIKTIVVDKCKQLWSDIKAKWNEIKTAITSKCSEIITSVKTKWNEIKTAITSKCGEIITGVKTKFNEVKTAISTKIGEIKTNAQTKFGEIKTAIVDKFNQIKAPVEKAIGKVWSAIKPIVDKLKGAFNFKWSLPKLKLPHLSVTGGEAPFGLGGKGSLPKFSIKWYKQGALLKAGSNAIFGMNGNTLMAGGEHSTGGEAILPLNTLFKEMNGMFDKQTQRLANMNNNNSNNQPIVVQVTLDGKVVAQSTIKNMKEMARLGNLDTSWL